MEIATREQQSKETKGTLGVRRARRSVGADRYRGGRGSQRHLSEGEMVQNNLPLVRQIVKQVAGMLPSSVEHDEVMSWATQGLLDAIRKFDPEAGTAFSTYARIRVRGAILDELRCLDWASRTARQKANHLRRTVQTLQHKLGRDAGQEEVAEALGVSIEKYHQMRGEASELKLLSLEDVSPGRNDDNLSFEEFLPAQHGDPMAMLLAREKRDALQAAIEQLPGKERLVLPLYYRSELTMKEVGDRLGITESRVSQLHTKALSRLRGVLSPQPTSPAFS
jgi:RNA polymerase sigma factor for flagellar operon FliA